MAVNPYTGMSENDAQTPTLRGNDFKGYYQSLIGSGLDQQGAFQAMYNTAAKEGWRSDQVDSLMGWGAGSTDQWRQANNLDPLYQMTPKTQTPGPAAGVQFGGGGYTPGSAGATGQQDFGAPPTPQAKPIPSGTQTVAPGGPSLLPHNDSTVPGGQTPTPGGQTPTPGGQTPTPGGQTPTPGGQTPTPGGQTPTPGGQTPTPYNAPDVQEVQAGAAGQAIARDVTPDQMVSSQIMALLNGDNPYIAQARQRAMEFANKRGVLNSSIAANAGETAAIEAALPIAQADAATFGEAAQKFTDTQNTMNLSAQEAQQQLIQSRQQQIYDLQSQYEQSQDAQEMARIEAELTRVQDEINFLQDIDLQDRAAQDKLDFMTADAEIRTQLAAVEQQYAVELETLKSDYQIMENLQSVQGALYSDAMKSLATLLDNDKLSGQAVTDRAGVIVNNLKASLDFVSGMTSTPQAVQLGGSYAAGDGGDQPAQPDQATQNQDLTAYVQDHSGSGDGSYEAPYRLGGIGQLPGSLDRAEALERLVASGAEVVNNSAQGQLYRLPTGYYALLGNEPSEQMG